MASPKVDDQFWFDYSYDTVKDSINRLNTAIERTKTFMTGLLTVFTGSAIFTIEYKDLENPLLIILFALPYIIVLFGEWHATTSSLPKCVNFDPRSPDEIREAYIHTHDFKSKKLRTQVIISFTATFFVAVTLMLGFLIGNRKIMEDKKNSEPYIETSLSSNDNSLLITGKLPPNSNVGISLTNFFKDDSLQVEPAYLLNSKEGVFFYSFQLDSLVVKSEVKVEWEENDLKKAIIKEIKLGE